MTSITKSLINSNWHSIYCIHVGLLCMYNYFQINQTSLIFNLAEKDKIIWKLFFFIKFKLKIEVYQAESKYVKFLSNQFLVLNHSEISSSLSTKTFEIKSLTDITYMYKIWKSSTLKSPNCWYFCTEIFVQVNVQNPFNSVSFNSTVTLLVPGMVQIPGSEKVWILKTK